MINIDTLITRINQKSPIYFEDFFNLKKSYSGHNLIYRTDGTSTAINRFEIPFETVKVLKWFNNFWVFLEIKTIKFDNERTKKADSFVNISFCVFQGDISDPEKYQLFRAEWDDFCREDEIHSQPHWHITSSQAIERSLTTYANLFEQHDFINLLEMEKQSVYDVKHIHFAMNGNWANSDTNIHKIDDIDKIINWWIGMLNHLRIELE